MTNAEAKDEILGIVLATFTRISPAFIALPVIPIRWPLMPESAMPAVRGFWSRVTYSPVAAPQGSLAGQTGKRRFETTAQLLVQIYAPITVPDAGDVAEAMGGVMQHAFQRQSPSGQIMFLNPNVRTAANTDTHYIINVSVTCKYDTYA